MADGPDGTTVSREAHDRIKAERDALKTQVEELSTVVRDVGIRDKARAYFVDKGVTNADWAADLALPHLRDVEIDKIGETLEGDRFKPLIVQATPPVEPTGEPPAEPAPSGFSGPSPGTPGGTPPTPQKLSFGSPEVQSAIVANDTAQFAKWEAEDRIAWDPRVIAAESQD